MTLTDKPVIVAIPHRSTLPLLEAVLPLWRYQSVRTWILVVDTGSTPKEIEQLEALGQQRLFDSLLVIDAPVDPTHYSGRIAEACELAQGTGYGLGAEFLMHTHTDVFPMRQDLLECWSRICREEEPVVGYRMSPRDHAPGTLRDWWRDMVGHTLTMCHLPTLKKHEMVWSRAFAEQRFGAKTLEKGAWDTEVTFNLCLHAAGIRPLFMGFDKNFEKLSDGNHVHCRSYPSQALFFPETDYAKKSAQWVEDEIQASHARAWEWSH